MIKNKVQCVPIFNESTKRYIGFIDIFDLLQCIPSFSLTKVEHDYVDIVKSAGSSIMRPDFFQVFKRQSFGDAHISKVLSM